MTPPRCTSGSCRWGSYAGRTARVRLDTRGSRRRSDHIRLEQYRRAWIWWLRSRRWCTADDLVSRNAWIDSGHHTHSLRTLWRSRVRDTTEKDFHLNVVFIWIAPDRGGGKRIFCTGRSVSLGFRLTTWFSLNCVVDMRYSISIIKTFAEPCHMSINPHLFNLFKRYSILWILQ